MKSKPRFVKSLELLHIFIVFLAIFLTLALISYNPLEGPGSDKAGRSTGVLGQAGSKAAEEVLTVTFGRYGAFAIPVALFLVLAGWWSRGRMKPLKWIIASLAAGFFTGFGFAYFRSLRGMSEEIELTGVFPLHLNELSMRFLQPVGTGLVAGLLILALLIILTNLRLSRFLAILFYEIPVGLGRGVATAVTALSHLLRRKPRTRTDAEVITEQAVKESPLPGQDEEPGQVEREVLKSKPEPVGTPAAKVTSPKPGAARDFDGAISALEGKRKLPPIRLLNQVPIDQPVIEPEELEENSRRLEGKLRSLKIEAKVLKTLPGPVITRYDLKPAEEVKIARIANTADDIAMALRARGVRILAPIPGEAAVGVEIPNRHPATVYIREIAGSETFRSIDSPLTIALGKDAAGEIFCIDLAQAPHLLIAGETGSGKSVCINSILVSLLYRADPKDVRFVLIDPKKIELSLYARLTEQHLLAPPGLGENVVTTPDNAVKALLSVHYEMERRYDILAEAGVRGLDEYNRWIRKTAPEDSSEIDSREHLPYIVVIIDELADLMMVVRREFEELVVRLAQMARAVGIHLIVATQRPSVDVVTGLIKANFPSRIAFRVFSKVDSRTIIDSMGAETLLGRGDMLYQGTGSTRLIRVHGALVTTEEVERVVEFVSSQPPCESTFSLPDPDVERVRIATTGNIQGRKLGTDEYFEEAARIVVHSEQGSISVLQRRLPIGYARAARLIDELEQAGIVGSFDGSKAREVLVTPEELREIHGIEWKK